MTYADSNNHWLPGDQEVDHEYPVCLSVVVPVYNEAATLGVVVRKLLSVPCLFEIIIVDDCSTDGTEQKARELAELYEQVRVVRHERNAGKTAALRTGFALTTGQVVIVQDADLEYDPAEIYGVIRPILEGHADVVVTLRRFRSRSQGEDVVVGPRVVTRTPPARVAEGRQRDGV